MTYHLFRPTGNPLDTIADYILAGDGVYGILDCFGMRTPVPLAPCEVRGLPPLFSWFSGTCAQEEETELSAFTPTYHLLTQASPALPPIDPHRIYQYVLARQGVFLLAQCTGLRCLLPISLPLELPGLAPATPFVDSAYPPVGVEIVLQILEQARAACDNEGRPIEQLYYLLREHNVWRLVIPEQDATRESVRASSITPEYAQAFIEGHSHHGLACGAKFSHGDDIAEVKGGAFRVYFVLGRVFTQPELRVRLCVHGYVCEVFAHTFFQLPQGVSDGVAKEWRVPA